MSNLVGYEESDEEDEEERIVEPQQDQTKRVKLDETTTTKETKKEFQQLCNLVKESNGKYSFAASCRATKFFKIPDIVDQIAENHHLASKATQLPSDVLRVEWDARHDGGESDAKG